jgi:putative transposase
MQRPDQPHRKTVEHQEAWRRSRMLTFSCYKRRELMLEESRREVVAQALTRALVNHGWLMTAFVFMPEHVHILGLPWQESAGGADDLLFAIKRPSSFRIKQSLRRAGDPLADELTILERPGKTTLRFWQEGPGHDRNVRDPDELGKLISYIHWNPVERGLCSKPEEWTWSSAKQYRRLPVDGRVPTVTRWSWWRGLELEPWGD